ncbi:MAG: glycosyltransferase family 4 protein [Chloroflexi bacterium]|nr:glycosyltransferase family 4 protein [Chloroflexota bacterium]
MRVVIVSNLFPPDIGGPATYVPRIARELQARGHGVTVVGGAPPGHDARSDRGAFPFPVHRVSRGLSLPIRLVVAVLMMVRAAWRADCIYVQGLAGPEMVAVLFGWLLRRPVVLKIVGDNAWEYAIRQGLTDDGIERFQDAAYGFTVSSVRAMVRWVARRVTRLIVPSQFLGVIVQGWGVRREAVRVVTNALTTHVATEAERVEARAWVRGELGRAGPYAVTVARLYPWKNLDVLIRMVLHFPPAVTLVVVGDGPEMGRLTTIVEREGLSRRVILVGGRSHDDTQRFLRAADAFVLNTRYEGLSHVLLEAMAAGAPAAVSAIGGNPEVIRDGENGLLFAVDDRDGIARAMARLVGDGALAERLRARAMEDVRAYRWPVLVEQTARTLEEAAGVRPAPGTAVSQA